MPRNDIDFVHTPPALLPETAPGETTIITGRQAGYWNWWAQTIAGIHDRA